MREEAFSRLVPQAFAIFSNLLTAFILFFAQLPNQPNVWNRLVAVLWLLLFLFLQFLYSGFHFPLSCSQFLMFEFARSGNGTAVQEILAKSRQIGVELEEFLNTLLGK